MHKKTFSCFMNGYNTFVSAALFDTCLVLAFKSAQYSRTFVSNRTCCSLCQFTNIFAACVVLEKFFYFNAELISECNVIGVTN